MRWRLMVLLVGTQVLASGCVATETGNPSFVPRSDRNEGLFTGEIPPDAPLPLPDPPPSMVWLSGGAGAIDPATGDVVVWNLDREVPVARSPVVADGSFRVEVEGFSGERFRAHVVDEMGLVTDPFDFTVDFAGLQPFESCLQVAPAVTLASDGRYDGVTVRNACPADLAFTVDLRGEGWTVADLPSLAPGASISLEGDAGSRPALLILRAADGTLAAASLQP